jgi:radical SAM protein with 4Fe4S-binding SPASM domain
MPEFPKRGYFRMDIADNCNIRCIMCQAYNSMSVNAMKFMDFDRFVESTRGELRKWQRVQLGNVAEATVHPRFADFVRYIRSEAPDALIHIVTNGKLLGKYAPVINAAGNCLVQVSMDSVNKATHEYIRAGSNFDRAIANLGMLDLSRTQVLLSFTLMASNIDEYPEMIDFCRSRGYQMSAFPMIVRNENGVLPLRLLRECLWFHIDKLRFWLKEHYGNQYTQMVGSATGAMEYVADFWCNAHYDDANVDAGGNLNICGKLGLGDLNSRPLREIWDSVPANEFRNSVEADRGPCMSCDYRQRCLSPSMALLDNHFSESIIRVLSPQAKKAIGYDRTLSDDDALWTLIADIQEKIGVFDIQDTAGVYSARRVSAGPERLLSYSDPVTAPSAHAMQVQLQALSASEVDPRLVVEGLNGFNIVKYLGCYWGIPLSLGQVNLVYEGDRRKPGIIQANTLHSIQTMCSSATDVRPQRGACVICRHSALAVVPARPVILFGNSGFRVAIRTCGGERWRATSG